MEKRELRFWVKIWERYWEEWVDEEVIEVMAGCESRQKCMKEKEGRLCEWARRWAEDASANISVSKDVRDALRGQEKKREKCDEEKTAPAPAREGVDEPSVKMKRCWFGEGRLL